MKLLISAIACCVLATNAMAQDSGEIAVFTKNKIDPFFQEARVGAEASANSLGFAVVQYAPTKPNNFQEQIAQVEDAITREPAGMVFVPVDPQGLGPSVDKVAAAGIPIVNYIEAGAGSYTATVIYDDVRLAREVTTILAEAMGGRGNVVIIEGIKGSDASDKRTAGALEALEAYPDIKVLAIQPANYQRGQALQVTENLLQQFPQIDGVVTASDNMGLAALEAFSSAGKPQPFVVGMDGTLDGVNSINEGGMLASAESSGFTMGCIGVEMIAKLSRGQDVPAFIELVAKPIVAENADEFGTPVDQRTCPTMADLGL